MKSKLVKKSSYGRLILLIGISLAIPVLLLPFYPEEAYCVPSFLIPSVGAIIVGILLCFLVPEKKQESETVKMMQYGSKLVLFAWCFGFLLGAVPFIISGQLSFTGALFEAVSGWTTTGLSVMDVSVTPHLFLFYRSMMQFFGGLGFIMMMILIVEEKQSMLLYYTEGHPDKLLPNLKRTAQMIFVMYLCFLGVGTVAYILAGMPAFDSITHAMCALSTGGFSIRLGSIGEYHSIPIEIITVILMLIGTTNFAVLFLLVKGKVKQFAKVSEVRFLAVLLAIAIPLLTLSLMTSPDFSIGKSFRMAFFDGISALSTTGYSSMSYEAWPQAALAIMIVLMLIGGGLGSTAGGMKLSRVYLVFRILGSYIKKRCHPARRVIIPYYQKPDQKAEITTGVTLDTFSYTGSYMMIFIIGSFLISVVTGCDLTKAMFEFSSSLGTVGLSIGLTNPQTEAPVLYIEMIGMILGRLEIFLVFHGIYSLFQKGNHH